MSDNLSRDVFEIEMQKIVEQFGVRNYGSARFSLIYKELMTLKDFQYREIINTILSTFKFAPLPVDFSKLARPYITKNYEIKKERERKESKEIFTSEQVGQVASALIKGIEGEEDFFNKITEGMKNLNKAKCKHCNDTGLIYAKTINENHLSDKVFNCFCANSANNHNYPKWGSRFADELINKNML